MPRSLRSLVNVRRISGLARCVAASPDWIRVIPAYFGITKPAFPHDIRLRNGIRITTWHPKEIITAWIVLFGDEYCVDPEARVIVDAGANIGAFSLFAAFRAPGASIVSIEPSKPTFDCLNHNIAQNNLGDRVATRNWALAGRDAMRRMEGESWPSHVRRLAADSASDSGSPVEAVSLSTLFEREKLGRVDLLKIDIEGAEWELFEEGDPAVLADVRAIAIEIHPKESRRTSELFDRIKAAGFHEVGHHGATHFARRP
jgi:FkbM family methyltransferase